MGKSHFLLWHQWTYAKQDTRDSRLSECIKTVGLCYQWPLQPFKQQEDFRNTIIFKTNEQVQDAIPLRHNRPAQECERGRSTALRNGPHPRHTVSPLQDSNILIMTGTICRSCPPMLCAVGMLPPLCRSPATSNERFKV